MRITYTTDGKFLGREVELADEIDLGGGFKFIPTKTEQIPGGVRLSNSNYVIDVKE